MSKIDYSKEKDVIAVIEYGSYARGDSDVLSDYDLFILTRQMSEKKNASLKERVSSKINNINYDLTVYNEGTFELMLKHGSLFLWHLKLEGKLVYQQNDLSKDVLFEELVDFKGSVEDMFIYHRIYNSSVKSVEKYGVNLFDLTMLSVLARNSLIVFCYNKQEPQFGRKTVFDSALKLTNNELPISKSTYNQLIDYRFVYSRGANITSNELPNKNEFTVISNQVNDLIIFVMRTLGIETKLDRVKAIVTNRIDRDLYTSFEIDTEFERDLYISLLLLCRRSGYTLLGLESQHQELFRQKCEKLELYETILLGFNIYNSFQVLKKDTSTYGSESNIFKYQYPDSEFIIKLKKRVENIENSRVTKLLRSIKFLRINTIIDLLMNFLNFEIDKNLDNFVQDLTRFAEIIRNQDLEVRID